MQLVEETLLLQQVDRKIPEQIQTWVQSNIMAKRGVLVTKHLLGKLDDVFSQVIPVYEMSVIQDTHTQMQKHLCIISNENTVLQLNSWFTIL